MDNVNFGQLVSFIFGIVNDRVANEAVIKSMQSGLELLKAVQDNPSFKKWFLGSAFNATYQPPTNLVGL